MLLNYDVFNSWKVDAERHPFDIYIGASDDLRFALSLNKDMKVLLVHGIYDLVTPYYASERVMHLMKLDDATRKNIHVENYLGGHMFYARESSRKEFASSAKAFINA